MKQGIILRHAQRLARRLRGLLLASLLLTGGSGVAAAAGLLRPAIQADAAAASASSAPIAPEAVRTRLAELDSAELARHVAPLGMDAAPDRIGRAQRLDGIITIELFPDVAATFHRKDVEAIGDTGYAWIGEVRDEPFSFVSLIIDDGQITGHVQLEHRLFRIDPVAGGIHRVTELDSAKFPPETFVRPPQRANGATPRQDDLVEPLAATQITVLVAFTPAARRQSSNIRNEVKQAISLANAAYRNTNIPIRLVLVKIISTGAYPDGNNWEKNLNDVTSGASLSNVRAARNANNADLVSLFRSHNPSTGICGVGWLPDDPGPSTAGLGYSVMSRGCVSNYSFHHELGHNQGLHHDRYVEEPAPESQYHFGYVNLGARIRTVMAYNNRCVNQGFNCARINWFSTPHFEFDNKKIGVPQGTAGAADNTRRLRETRTAISQYRSGEGAVASVAAAATGD